MAGFSAQKEVQEAIDKTHDDLVSAANKFLKKGDHVLDIGCGAGAYLKHFTKDFVAHGIDLNADMIEAGTKNLPAAEFIYADFLKYDFRQQFKFIYSVSVLEFIAPSDLNSFFKKVHDLLLPEGIFFLHYPHALSKHVLHYPDLYYLEYSPALIEAKAKKNFEIITHHHGYDGRMVEKYDQQPYGNGARIFKNGYLLIALKKK